MMASLNVKSVNIGMIRQQSHLPSVVQSSGVIMTLYNLRSADGSFRIKFKVNHKGRSGRTGSMFAKQIAGRVVGRPRSRLASDQRLTAAEGLALNSQQTAGAACEP
jgi:hypothetical protein